MASFGYVQKQLEMCHYCDCEKINMGVTFV